MAASLAAAEQQQRAEAQGLSEQLRAEGERRAKQFKEAVSAAVGRVQAELEAERDALQAK